MGGVSLALLKNLADRFARRASRETKPVLISAASYSTKLMLSSAPDSITLLRYPGRADYSNYWLYYLGKSMLLWPPLPYIQCWKKSHHFVRGKSNIDKAEGGYLKSDATFPTLLSRIVVQKEIVFRFRKGRAGEKTTYCSVITRSVILICFVYCNWRERFYNVIV